MTALRQFLIELGVRLTALFTRDALRARLDEEMRFHLDMRRARLIESGLSPADAEARARREFGNTLALRESSLDMWRYGSLERLLQDLRYAVRLLRRAPAFAAAAIISLALGIGANAAIFSLVDTVMLRQLPVERPGELVFIETAGTTGRNGAPGYPVFARIRDEASSLAGAAAFAADELRLEVDGNIEQVYGQVVSGSYFDLLGLKPVAGRLMTPDDERLEPPVAVIGYGYWQRRFGGSANAVGKTLTFRDRVFTIVGVTGPRFWGLQPGRQIDVSLPITQERAMLDVANASWFEAVARLRPGASVETATAEANAVFQSVAPNRERSEEMRQKRFARIELPSAARGLDRLRGRFGMPLYALAVLAAIVLLMTCANVSNLLMARGVGRGREFAIRLAAGAGAGRLLRQLLTETVLLFALGVAAGLVVAHLTIQALTGFFAIGRSPIVLDIQYNWRLAAFAGGVALAAALLTGLWPALGASRTNAHAAMKDHDGRVAGSTRLAAATRAILAGQVALSLVLLVPAMMFVTTMMNLRAVDLGFSGGRVLTMSLDPLLTGEDVSAAREQFWDRVLERVAALPDVRAASLSVLTPLSGRDTGKTISVAGFQPQNREDSAVHLNHVSEHYFSTFGIDVVEGRVFTARDVKGAVNAVVLNQSAAAAYFPGRSALGETVTFGKSDVYHVVGVVRDHKHVSVRREAPRFAFVPLRQRIDPISRITLAIKSDQPHPALTQAVAREVQAVYPRTLVSDVIAVEEQIDATLVSERLLSTLATAFAALALALAAIGLYGVLNYSVARRRNEFGVRLALGARPSRGASAVVSEVSLQVAIGVAIGLPAALAIARAAEGMMFGVAPTGAWHYVMSATAMVVVAILAAYLPARRAGRIDPVTALRAD